MENFYFILLILPVIALCILANKTEKKLYLYTSIVYLSLLVGLRGVNVGIDTVQYYDAINSGFPIKWKFEEIGFRYISTVLMDIFKNATIVILVYSFITNGLLMLRLWDFRKHCNFPMMITLYLLIYIFFPMNIMRQFIAISIIFYSTKLLDKKKYILFFAIVLLTSLIHKTAFLSLIFILVYYWGTLTRKQKVLSLIPIFIMTAISLVYIIEFEDDHISNYFSANNSINNLNITFIYRAIIFIISYLFYKSGKKIVVNNSYAFKNNDITIAHNDDDFNFKYISIFYLIGLLFSSTGMFFGYMNRIGLYYMCYEVVYWGFLIKNSKNRSLNFILIMIFAVYVFFVELIGNGSGIFPYQTILLG